MKEYNTPRQSHSLAWALWKRYLATVNLNQNN